MGLLQGVTTRRRVPPNCFSIRDQVRQQNGEDFFCSFNVGTPEQDSQEQVSGQKYFRRVAAMGYRSRQSRSPGPGNSRKLKIIETPQRSQVLAQTFDPRYWATATGACTGESRVFGSGSSSPGAYIHLCVVARRPEELLPEQHDGGDAQLWCVFLANEKKVPLISALSVAPPL